MHGVKKFKGTAEAEREKKEQTAKRVAQYARLLDACNAKRSSNTYDLEGLRLTGELLALNPECYSLWNYRRRAMAHLYSLDVLPSLQHRQDQDQDQHQDQLKQKQQHEEPHVDEDGAAPAAAPTTDAAAPASRRDERIAQLRNELTFTEECVRKNPKSYWIFNQREWATAQLHALGACDWRREFDLCALMLKYDSRNFHCWNYRRYVARMSPESTLAEELQFTSTKISENFSNYSAWHQRSNLLPLKFKDDRAAFCKAIEEELELVQNAFYTEPTDSSAWFYHRWLVSQHPDPAVIERELGRCRELLEIAEKPAERKWPTLTMVFLYQQHPQVQQHVAEIAQLLEQLIEIDPYRKHYYESLRVTATHQ